MSVTPPPGGAQNHSGSGSGIGSESAAADPYLAGLRLAGRRVVVVGGGPVAARRVAGLLGAGAHVELIAPHATPALDALAAAGRVTWHERPYQNGDLAGAWYAVAATDQPAVNAAVAAEAETARDRQSSRASPRLHSP